MPDSPFGFNRLSNIFGGPPINRVGPPSPFMKPRPNLMPEQKDSGFKRLFTSTIPTPDPAQSDSGAEASGSGIQGKAYFDILQQLSQDRPKQTAYEEALRNTPNREDYQPSGWRRFASALAGAGAGLSGGPGAGISAAEYINTSPYNNALQDYELRTEALRAEAESESAKNSEYRKNLEMATNFGLQESELKQKGAYQTAQGILEARKIEDAERGTSLQQQRDIANINQMIAEATDRQTKNELERKKIEILGRTASSEAGLRTQQGKAAIMSAEADRDRAGMAGKNPTVQEKQRARNLVLERLESDPKYSSSIDINQGEFGPEWTLSPRVSPEVLAEIEAMIEEELRGSYPGYEKRRPAGSSRPAASPLKFEGFATEG